MNKKSKKYIIIIGFLVLVLLIILSISGLAPKPVKSQKVGNGDKLTLIKVYPETGRGQREDFHQGKLYHAGEIKVLVLEGSYKEMGRQYGALLKDELNANYNSIVEGVKTIPGLTLQNLQEEGSAYYDTYPEKYRQIVMGIAETSGMKLDQIIMLQDQETYVYEKIIAMATAKAAGHDKCSGFAAWDDYTVGGKMIFGRNYDLGPINHDSVNLVVYNPIDGSIPSSSITFTGSIYTTSGMNRDGLFLELNNGGYSDPGEYVGQRTFAPISLFHFLEQAHNTDQLSMLFNTTRPDLGYIINAADAASAYSFEWSTSKVVRRGPDKPGVLSATNVFFDPSWGKQEYDVKADKDLVVKRRDNLLALGEKYKGQITPEVMQKIMALPLADGGSFRAPNLTSYQMVALPSDLKIWLRIPGYQDWVKIDLAQFFNK